MTIAVRVGVPDVQLVALDVEHARYRREVIFRCHKWDPQVDDVDTVCDHACVLSQETAALLSARAEALSAETMALEAALIGRTELHAELGIPRALRSVLAASKPADTAHVRVMRFDFHPTLEDWALSEVNSDVPGGFAEASTLPKLAAAYARGVRAGADAGDALATAFARRLPKDGRIALVHATSYADDRQVMQFLATRFAAAGFACVLAAPDHLRWKDGRAIAIADGQGGAIDGIVRFFPAEWLPALPRAADWHGFFRTRTVSCNPGQAVLTQSKRLPLLWDRLGADVPAWRALLSETRDPRAVPWHKDESWLVKPAFGRVGEGIARFRATPEKIWRKTRMKVALAPRDWVAQRRFVSRKLPSRHGARHLCIGVFTVDGRAAGFYGRLSANEVIDKHAQDIAVLICEGVPCP